MRRLPPIIAVTLIVLVGSAARADFADGAQAYDGGHYQTAFEEWIALARNNDTNAQVAIAGMYRFGEGRPVDLADAARWYRRAADLGDATAQLNLGEMYMLGLGVPLVTAYHIVRIIMITLFTLPLFRLARRLADRA